MATTAVVTTVAGADNMPLRVRLTAHPKFVPSYATEGSAGADLRADIPETIVIHPQERIVVSTGIRIEIPRGYEGQVRPRSGLAVNYGVTVLNAPGTIDSDYRGEVGVPLINHGDEPFRIEPGMRVAQLVITPVMQAQFIVEDTISGTRRGTGGFGSSGIA